MSSVFNTVMASTLVLPVEGSAGHTVVHFTNGKLHEVLLGTMELIASVFYIETQQCARKMQLWLVLCQVDTSQSLLR